ncbi:MAG: sulfotransferase [Rikenellaceae bacterium]
MDEKKKEFTIVFPITTLVGADCDTFKASLPKGEWEDKYKLTYRISKSVCWILNLIRPIEDRRYKKLLADKPIEQDPVFILGHWRSGTTMVHNLMSQDKQFGYCTTYQTVFPNIMLWGQPFFKKAMAIFMPKTRATDGVKLGVDLPQEEEFALSNMMPYNFYRFWFLPKNMLEYSRKYLLFKDATQQEKDVFKAEFTRLIKLAMYNTGGKRFLSKNPPHTGRVKEILEMFPNAKFVFLMRDPYAVFASTSSFFNETIKPLKLQEITKKEIDDNILKIYTDLYQTYQSDKKLIPNGNLIEIKFEDFEADGLDAIKRVYESLSLDGYAESVPAFKAYLDKQKTFVKNVRKPSAELIEKVNSNWGDIITEWNYNRY